MNDRYGRWADEGSITLFVCVAVMGLLLLAGLVLLIVWLIRALVGPTAWRPGSTASPAAQPDSPLDILSRRFAAGEITVDEFKKAREVLRETKNP